MAGLFLVAAIAVVGSYPYNIGVAPGIAESAIARAFDRFYKGSGSPGSALGLTIARNLVAAHGGEIHASSEPARGTTITFTLPQGRV